MASSYRGSFKDFREGKLTARDMEGDKIDMPLPGRRSEHLAAKLTKGAFIRLYCYG
ncbi:hypothetical protein ACFLW2_03070 [Chloroflexota bacterium]